MKISFKNKTNVSIPAFLHRKSFIGIRVICLIVEEPENTSFAKSEKNVIRRTGYEIHFRCHMTTMFQRWAVQEGWLPSSSSLPFPPK